MGNLYPVSPICGGFGFRRDTRLALEGQPGVGKMTHVEPGRLTGGRFAVEFARNFSPDGPFLAREDVVAGTGTRRQPGRNRSLSTGSLVGQEKSHSNQDGGDQQHDPGGEPDTERQDHLRKRDHGEQPSAHEGC